MIDSVIGIIDLMDIFFLAHFFGINDSIKNKKKIWMNVILIILLIYAGRYWTIQSLNLLGTQIIILLWLKCIWWKRMLFSAEVQALFFIIDSSFSKIAMIAGFVTAYQDEYYGQIVYCIFRNIIIFICLWYFYQKKFQIQKAFSEIGIGYSIYIISSTMIVVFIMSIVHIWMLGETLPKGDWMFILGTTLFAVMQFVLCLLMQYLAYSRKKLNKLSEEQQKYIFLQKQYLDEIEQKNNDIRKFSHDYHEQIDTLYSFCEHGEIEKLKSYIRTLTDRKNADFYVNVRNMAGSAVINKYREKIEEKGIRFICIGKFPEEIGNISDVDICTILSNLLKNALEAAVLYDGALEKKIQLLIQWYNTEILLKITNPSNAVGDLSGTSKADKKNHGIGLQNVKDAVEKYHGYLKTEYEKEIFCVRIVLPIGENDTQI